MTRTQREDQGTRVDGRARQLEDGSRPHEANAADCGVSFERLHVAGGDAVALARDEGQNFRAHAGEQFGKLVASQKETPS